MITDEIQELLDGSLGDERTAELLHSLSVSPEKRAAFAQHLGLRAAIQRDRLASTLSAAEDSALWGTIAGPGAIPIAHAANVGRSWLVRGAALLATGIIGYVLGTTTIDGDTAVNGASTNNGATTIADTRADRVQHATNITRKAPAVGVESPAAANISPSPASGSAVKLSSNQTAAARVIYRDRVVYRDRIVYRDKIVYRDPIASAAQGEAVQGDVERGADASSSLTPNAAASQSLDAGAKNASIDEAKPTSPSVQPDSDAATNSSGGSPQQIIPADSIAAPKSIAEADGSGVNTAHVTNDASTNLRSGDDDLIASDMGDEKPSPIDQGGWDLVYAERVGILAPAPSKIESDENGFSYRLLGLHYWFDGGRLGVGARAGYGSFSSVELRTRDSRTGLGPEITGTVTSTERVWMEGVLAYRYPLMRDLSLSLEAALGGSTHHMKVSGDLVATYFVTDFLGLQAGAGLGHYWYSVAGERDRLLEDTPTGGVTSETSTDYQGLMFEGRYGLFVRF